MKNKVLLVSLIALVCLSFAAPTEAANMAQKLKGKILLQVESKGEAWYVHPVTLKRHSLGRPDDAFKVMREQGLGISEEDYAKMLEKAPAKFAGRILLRVQAHGEAYYVHPTTLKLYFLGRPADAFKVMRELGLGIKNSDIEKISTSSIDCGTAYPDKVADMVYTETLDDGTATTTKKDYDKDVAMTCFGKALLNNCQPAVLKVKSEFGTVHTEEIIGKSGANCTLKVEYKDVVNTDTDQLMYENSYLQCHYPQALIPQNACYMTSTKTCQHFGIQNSPAHTYAGTFGSMALAALFSPDQISCSGNMVEKIKNYQP